MTVSPGTQPPVTYRTDAAVFCALAAAGLSLSWCLIFFAGTSMLGLARSEVGEVLPLLDVLLHYKGTVLLAAFAHYLALSALQPALGRGVPPDRRRLLWAGAAMLLASAPTPYTAGPLLGLSPALLAAAGLCCLWSEPGRTWSLDSPRTLFAALSLVLCLFLVVGFVAGLEIVPPSAWPNAAESRAAKAVVLQTPEDALSRVRRLPLRSFGLLSKEARAELKAADCEVPQSAFESSPHNVFSAPLLDPDQGGDFVALCSKKGEATVRIVWNDPKAETLCSRELSTAPDQRFIGATGPGKLGYARIIRPVSPEYLLKAAQAEGKTPPVLPPGLMGIEDEFVGKESSVFYCLNGQWLTVPGSRPVQVLKSTGTVDPLQP
ncbi:MAG: hypothetical protein A2X36_01255 [Elusimicrobia bacterium GWA2_69_24]|nr:MAG: hypothetical protein A2X36_01255 [Elusimicrobia bacterium GWA2_69_24]HBL16492.1 hypothetical protein [Elusimicrobiota bacterium]